MAKLLHLETSTKACSVALSIDGKLVALKESVTEDFSHSENLTLYIQDVLDQCQLKLNDIQAVSVASGPGSYTGLRIGVSTAKGLCYALSIPLIAVDSLISLAHIAKQKYPQSNLIPMIDARRMEVFSAVYSSDLNSLKEISADVVDENSYKEYEPFVYFGDGANKLQEIWKDRLNAKVDTEIFSSAKGQISIAFEKFQTGRFENLAYFEPFYLKDFITPQKKQA